MWPKGFKAALAIGIDDVHPESSKENGLDFGGDLEQGNLGLLTKLLEEFPRLAITLFITPNWRLKTTGGDTFLRLFQKASSKIGERKLATQIIHAVKSHPDGKYRLDKSQFREWCHYITKKAEENKFLIGLHGFNHLNPWLNYASEFEGLTYEECLSKIKEARNIFRKARMPLPRGFAPPGWKVTGSLINVLIEEGFTYIAGAKDHLSPVKPHMYCNEAGMCVPLFYPETLFGGLVSIPRNWDIKWSSIERAENIIKINGIMGIHGHVAKTPGISNEISRTTIKNLRELLMHLEKKHPNDIWFTNFADLAKYWKKRHETRGN